MQEHARGLSRALVAAGHDVTLFGPELRGPQERLQGVATVSLGPAVNVPANGSIAPLGIDPRMLVRFDLQLDAADVVHVHESFLPASLAAMLRRPKRTAVVGTFHAAAESFWPYALTAPLLRRLSKRLDATTAVSPEARRLVRRYVALDPEIIPNGVDVEFYEKAQADEWATKLGTVVLFCGRNEPRKGFDVVVRAFTSVAATRPDVHLVCFPAEPTDVPDDIGPVAERIHCLGRITEERKAALHRAAEVSCFASTGRESFGVVVLEGLAGGSAVIASDIAGYRYAGGDAVTYAAPGDVSSWRDALARLLDDPVERERVAAGGPERARMFDWSSIAQQTISVYERALSTL